MSRHSTKFKSKPAPKRSLLVLWLSLTGLVLVFVAAWGAMTNSAQSKTNIAIKGEPRLSLEKTVIDRGDVKLGTPVRDEIRVTNVGDQPLRFTETPYIEVLEGC